MFSSMNKNVATRPASTESQLPGLHDLGAVAVLLDVDGTILDMAITPSSVVVTDSLRSVLDDLHARCEGALALVSGRLIRNLDALFSPLRLPAIGGHGAEMRFAVDGTTQIRRAAVIGPSLRDLICAAAASDPRIIVEDKGTSLAVHYRLAPQAGPTLRTKIAAILNRVGSRGLEIMQGRAVLEIKPIGFSKGEAVLELMKHPPFAHRRPVFVGDDTTDETVFNVLPTLDGVGYSVERPMPGASGVFASPRDVRRWLAQLCGGEDNARP
jgi:trehalose 6-phosphate phosphatase